MAAKAGRKVLVYYTPPNSTEEVAIGALKSKTVSLNKEPIDITTDDDNGYRQYLADVDSLRSCDIKLSGVLKDRILLDYVDQEAELTLRFVFPGTTTAGVQIAGSFKFQSAELSAEMEDAATFDYSFASSGAFTLGAVA